jgi:Asp-tRNA(Asn)/Glu-tRNA(Gln) amidotransferase C subunit
MILSMTRSEAEQALGDIEGVLQQVSQYHKLSEEQRLAIHARAGQARQKIEDVVKLLKKLEKAANEDLAHK